MSQSRLFTIAGLGLVGVAGTWLIKRLRRGQYDDLDSAFLLTVLISSVVTGYVLAAPPRLRSAYK